MVLVVKNPSASAGDVRDLQSLHQEDPLEEGMATHSSFLAWRIPWTEEPGGLVHGVAEFDPEATLALRQRRIKGWLVPSSGWNFSTTSETRADPLERRL